MLKQLLLLCILVVLTAQNCHYSCSTCTGAYYTSCLRCSESRGISVVQNPSAIPRQFWSSLYPSGTCIDTSSSNHNGLGIVLFLFLTISCLIIRTKQSFYLYLTIQTFGLFNLIEIGWLNPLGFVLQSMQYLMIWNIIGSKYKTQDYILTASKNYRIKRFLHQTQIGQNFALIAAFTIIALAILIVVCIISIRRNRQKRENQSIKQNELLYQNIINQSEMDRSNAHKRQEEQPQVCACWKAFTEDILVQLAKLLIVFLCCLVQQTMVVLLVSLVLRKPVGVNIIILCVLYLHILVFIMSYGYYNRIEYFKDKTIMYITYAKKIILPVMVVVPITNQYLIFIFAFAILALEFYIDYSNRLYEQLSRLLIYKLLEIVTVLLLLIYYIVEVNSRSYSASMAASIACTLLLAAYLACFVVIELPLGIKQKYFDVSKKGVNQVANNEVTLQQINDQVQPDKNEKQLAKVNAVQIKSFSNECQEQEEGSDDANNGFSRQMDENSLNDKQGIEKAHPIFNQLDQRHREKSVAKDQNNSMVTKKGAQSQPPQTIPAKKKKRKQIIDKQLRLRYGI